MLTIKEQREAVCTVARTWIGTPYHHAGRVKGAGVDCATFIAQVYEEAGIVPHLEIGYYPADWHLHRDDERYMQFVLQYAREIEEADVAPGDIVLYRVGRAYAHGGIILEWPKLIAHAKYGDSVLLAHPLLDGLIVGRPRRFFSIFQGE